MAAVSRAFQLWPMNFGQCRWNAADPHSTELLTALYAQDGVKGSRTRHYLLPTAASSRVARPIQWTALDGQPPNGYKAVPAHLPPVEEWGRREYWLPKSDIV